MLDLVQSLGRTGTDSVAPVSDRKAHAEGGAEAVIKTLFVGNLPWSATQEDLQRLFEPHAEVIAARIATDRETGRSRGFGFVEVPADQAEAAIAAVNGRNFGGRPLTVNEARPREGRPQRESRYDRSRGL